MTDDESPEALSVRRGFDDAELATCLKVLRALGSDGGTANSESILSELKPFIKHNEPKPVLAGLKVHATSELWPV